MKKLLTEKIARAAKATGTSYEIRDTTIAGFGLRVSAAGKRLWSYTYGPRTARRRLDLGSYPFVDAVRARDAARSALAIVQAGGDPKEGADAGVAGGKTALTVAKLGELYVENYAKRRKRSWREDERMIALYLTPAWGERPASAVTRRQVSDLLEKVAESKPVQANRLLALISKLYAWGVVTDRVPLNPAYRLPKPTTETPRARVLTDPEIAKVWQACDADPSPLARIYQLMLLTGQRGGEVRKLAFDDVDDAGWWNLAPELTKNKRPQRVFLCQTASRLVAGLRRRKSQLHAFPTAHWHLGEAAATNPHKVATRVAETAALTKPWTPHDLRRTVTTLLARLGVSRLVVDRILNHADTSVTSVYDQYGYDREIREAIEALEREILRITGRSASVPAPKQPPKRSALAEHAPA